MISIRGGRWTLAGLTALCLFAVQPAAEAARSQERSASRPAAQQARTAAPARPAATAPRNTTAGRSTAPARPQAQASRSGRQQVAQQQARGRGFTAPYTRGTASASNLRQTAMASCTTRGGRRVCTAAPRNVSFRWSGGMPAPTLEQMTCPDGTMATTALGHTNVVRCVPL